MEENNNLSLEKMRMERGKYQSIYMKFANSCKNCKTYVFCFYEGEDGKYYDSRVRDKFKTKLSTYSVGNKKEVLKLLKKIRESGLYDNICTMFFIDRDYDDSLIGWDNDLFETPCYSIENLYVQKECLERILQSEFGLNETDKDYQKCICDFEAREKEFNNNILEFNTLAFLRRKKSGSNSNYSFGKVKTSHMVKIGVNSVSRAKKYEETLNQIRDELQFDESEVEKARKELIKRGNFSLNFRGKNQLDFFIDFIRELKKLSQIDGYFSSNLNNIHINITSNRLSELSQYAITPNSLENFLIEHQKNSLK